MIIHEIGNKINNDNNQHTVDMEKFAGLNFHGFNPLKF